MGIENMKNASVTFSVTFSVVVLCRVRLAGERQGVELEPLDGSENGPAPELIERGLVRNRLDPAAQSFAIYRDQCFLVAGQLIGESVCVPIRSNRATVALDFASFRKQEEHDFSLFSFNFARYVCRAM
jgi:hypothetical protein